MILQDNTKNISFIKLSYLLREMGIKNNTFFLRLYDESLYDIDPFDVDNLTLEQKIRIRLEIKRNPWYYFREISRVPDSSSGFFEMHRGNLALYTMLLLNVNCLFMTPRQFYKTTSVMNFENWGLDFGYDTGNTSVGLFTLSNTLSSNNLSRLKTLRDAIPSYLKIDDKKDINNATSIKRFKDGYFNSISTKAVGVSEETAEDSARGFSYQCLLYDEFAFITYISEHYSTAIHSFSTAARAAVLKDGFRHILMTTTAGYLTKPCGQWAYRAIEKAAPFHEKIYDMTYEDENGILQFDKQRIYSYIIHQSTGSTNILTSFVSIVYEWFELGAPDNYLETQREFCKNNPDPTAFEREVLMKWQTQSGDHPLGKNRVERLRDAQRKPNSVIEIDKIYFLNIYRNFLDRNIPYILGIDCSGNLNKDFSTVVALDPTNFEVVATMRINIDSIIRFSRAVVYIMNQIMPKSIALIERNGIGGGVVDYVQYRLNSSNRIWKDENGIYGVLATQTTRQILYGNILKVAATNYYNKIHDKHIISEILMLEYDSRGRVNHPKNGHDDTLMAYLWAMWFLLHSKNKSKYIDPIYIGLNMEDTYSSEEIEDKVMEKRRNISKFFGNMDYNHLFDGHKTQNEILEEQDRIIKNQISNHMNKNKKLSKENLFDKLKQRRDDMIKEAMNNVDTDIYKSEEQIDEVENLQKHDTEEIDKIQNEKKLKEQREKFWNIMNFNYNNKNNNNGFGN